MDCCPYMPFATGFMQAMHQVGLHVPYGAVHGNTAVVYWLIANSPDVEYGDRIAAGE